MSILSKLSVTGQNVLKRKDEYIKRLDPKIQSFSENLNLKLIAPVKNSLSFKFDFEWPGNVTPLTPTKTTELYQKLLAFKYSEPMVGEWYKIDQQRISAFADITEDHQWIHVDEFRAKRESPFRSTITHGFLLLSLLPKLSDIDAFGQKHYANARMVINSGVNDVKFISAVKAGDSVRARTKVADIIKNHKNLDIVYHISVESQNSGKFVCSAELISKVYV